MKKFKYLSLILCLVLALQCLAVPVSAAETTEDPYLATEAPAEPELMTQDSGAAFGTVSIQQGCRTINGMVPLGGTDRKLDTAQGVFLYEMNTETVVYSYNPDMKLAPGNLAKIVTSLIALEMCEEDELVTVNSVNISKLPAGAVNVKLKHDEQLTVADLVRCMIMGMANDAAVAIAEHVAGTQQAFVDLMNARVKQMGCTGTEFTNVHGLENVSHSYTTARDMAKIVVDAIKNEAFNKIFCTTDYIVPATERSKERELVTSNYLMDERIMRDFRDQRVIGGMQSYHAAYGANLVVTAKTYVKEGETVSPDRDFYYVGVILGATRVLADNGWQPLIFGNFNEMNDLIKFGFDKFKINRILYKGMSLHQFSVAGGESSAVGQSTMDYDTVVPIAATMDNLNIKYFVTNKGDLTAPIKKDQMIATMEVWYRNSCMAEAEVYSMGNVKAMNNTGVTIRSTAVRRDSDASGALAVIGTICVIVLGLAVAYLAFNAYMRSRARARHRRRREARRRNR